MTYAERTHRWNEWYDGLPERWQFQVVLWPLLLVGTINMMLTISSGFPFGLLVILAILFLAFVRLPYKAGFLAEPSGKTAERTVHLGRVDWLWEINTQYDALPEWRRFWVFPGVLVAAGAINMALTLGGGFPFGLLFLLALLAMVAIRVPYVWGWLTPPPGKIGPAPGALLSPPASNVIASDHELATIGHDEPAHPMTPTRDAPLQT